MLGFLIGTLMFFAAVFLILLILVQRGRGGGLTGALGGMGGQSAFGAKAGDTFTKITIWASAFWILLCMTAVVVLNRPTVIPNKNPGAHATGETPPVGGTGTGESTQKPAGEGATGTGTSGSGETGSGTTGSGAGAGTSGTGAGTEPSGSTTPEKPATGGSGD